MSDAPDASMAEVLRREAFEEIGRMSFLAEDYALKLYDATERLDRMAVAGRLQQLRFCALAMIQTFNLVLRKIDDQDVPEDRGPSPAHRQDQRTGDAVA